MNLIAIPLAEHSLLRFDSTMAENSWPEVSPKTRARIEEALARRNKIEAIKLYREATGADLKDSKEAIERGQSNDSGSNGFGFAGPSPALIILGVVIVILIATALIFTIYSWRNSQ